MRGINKAIIVGTLTRDPESKTFQNGGSLCQFSVATNESWTDKNTGERKESAEFHRIVANNRLGEIAQQYLRKGSKVYIEGKLKTRQWTDQNGQERYTTEISANELQMLDSKGDGNYQPNGQPAQQQSGGYGQQPKPTQPKSGGYGSTPAPADLDDDLPF